MLTQGTIVQSMFTVLRDSLYLNLVPQDHGTSALPLRHLVEDITTTTREV